jgi:hypothetical protein
MVLVRRAAIVAAPSSSEDARSSPMSYPVSSRHNSGNLLLALLVSFPVGCAAQKSADDSRVHAAVNNYVKQQRRSNTKLAAPSAAPADPLPAWLDPQPKAEDFAPADFTLGMTQDTRPSPHDTDQPRSARATRDDFHSQTADMTYWHSNVWHQMGAETRDFLTDGLWRGFKVSYANVPNAVALGLTLGASITFRESGVDDTVADRTYHHRELGHFDDTIQVIGNPITHFAGAGVLWLGTTMTQDMRDHEVAKALIEALCVNGISVSALKLATNTSSPDGDRYGWPSGHTSSSFTVAAVLNEYYGPWVGIPSLALAGLVGYERIDSRVHDFSDVVFGGVIGYVIGASIAREDKGQLPELFGMKVLPYADPETNATGIALWKQW